MYRPPHIHQYIYETGANLWIVLLAEPYEQCSHEVFPKRMTADYESSVSSSTGETAPVFTVYISGRRSGPYVL